MPYPRNFRELFAWDDCCFEKVKIEIVNLHFIYKNVLAVVCCVLKRPSFVLKCTATSSLLVYLYHKLGLREKTKRKRIRFPAHVFRVPSS